MSENLDRSDVTQVYRHKSATCNPESFGPTYPDNLGLHYVQVHIIQILVAIFFKVVDTVMK